MYTLTMLTIVNIAMSNTCISSSRRVLFCHCSCSNDTHHESGESTCDITGFVIWKKRNPQSFENRFSPSNLHSCIPCGVWSIVNYNLILGMISCGYGSLAP